MYRIKTDIRQYKCESIDKVEKLIRNWVIRPNDLIYHSDERDWLPIGEHPSFEKLFGILEEREAAEPDTVVTDDHPLLRNGAVSTDEATQITERPDFEDDEEDALDARETDIFDADQISKSLAERDRAAAEAEAEADGEDDEADNADGSQDAIEIEDSDAEDDGPDEASAGAEVDEIDEPTLDEDDDIDAIRTTDEVDSGPSKPLAMPEPPEGVEPPVNDEITVMTDKTLELMKVEDSEATEDDPEEVTNVTERPEAEPKVIVAEDAEDADETTTVAARTDDDEATQVVEAPSSTETDETEQKILVSAPTKPGKSAAAKGVGRHDLPEEFFATNEISGPIFEESAKVIDDLAAMEAERNAANDEDVDDGWDAISDDLDQAAEKPALGLRDTDEIAGEIDGDEILVDPLEETAIPAADEWDEDVSSVSGEDTAPEIAVEEFVSDGYKMPLPFKVGPGEKDVVLGLKRSKKSAAEKDAVFPYPEPKKRGEVHARVYYFSADEPRDLSVPIVVGVFLICLTIATIVGFC